jgi:hypothetical protein
VSNLPAVNSTGMDDVPLGIIFAVQQSVALGPSLLVRISTTRT